MAGLNQSLSTAVDNSFALTITRLPEVSFNCVNVSIPGLTSVDTTTETPTLDFDSPNGKLTFDPFVCRFLVMEDYSNWISVFNWLIEYQSSTDITKNKSDFSIVIPNNHGHENLSVDFVNGYPFSLDALDLSSTVSEPTPLTVGLTMKYQSFKVTKS